MTRVSGLIAFSKASTIRPGSSTGMGISALHSVVPLRSARSSQPHRPPGCSMSVISTSEPAGRSRPLARRFMPIVAFCVRATREWWALISSPIFVLSSVSGEYPERRLIPPPLQSTWATSTMDLTVWPTTTWSTRRGEAPMVPVLQYASSGGIGNCSRIFLQ